MQKLNQKNHLCVYVLAANSELLFLIYRCAFYLEYSTA